MDRFEDDLIGSKSSEREPEMAVINFVICRNDDDRHLLFAEARIRMSRNLHRLWLAKMLDKKSQK